MCKLPHELVTQPGLVLPLTGTSIPKQQTWDMSPAHYSLHVFQDLPALFSLLIASPAKPK